jgi:hypothetical protein
MLASIEHNHGGRRWERIIAKQRHFSEFILYGVWMDRHMEVPGTLRRLALEHWEEVPLNERTAREFAAQVEVSDVAVMVSAKSGTPPNVRELAVEAARFAAS